MRKRSAGLLASFASISLLASPLALAQTTPESAPSPSSELSAPPPVDIPYVQYGVALTTETVTSAGKMCAQVTVPCILGSGGGVIARLGRRSAGPWYFGAAYELSKQDPANLYRFATLQQARAEARWYLDTGRDIYPYATAESGIVAYGDEWAVDTYGPVESLGVGLEAQVSRRIVVGFEVTYRVLLLKNFSDSSGYERDTSVAQMVGVALTLEERGPIASALPRQ